MQPFDEDKFDSRYDDVIAASIREAGLEPYRIDEDPSSEILIDTIEEEIRKSKACVAEITTNNPNVWYELGYALALHKKVLLICSDERTQDYPFDVRHRNILQYKTRSVRDYKELGHKITKRLEALLSESSVSSEEKSKVNYVDYVTNHELKVLKSIISEEVGNDRLVSEHDVNQYMIEEGYSSVATRIGIEKLISRGYISKEESKKDIHGGYYTGYTVTDEGYSWIIDNEDKFELVLTDQSSSPAPDEVSGNTSLGAKASREGEEEDQNEDDEDSFEPDDDLPF